jgi:hypothetical protein
MKNHCVTTHPCHNARSDTTWREAHRVEVSRLWPHERARLTASQPATTDLSRGARLTTATKGRFYGVARTPHARPAGRHRTRGRLTRTEGSTRSERSGDRRHHLRGCARASTAATAPDTGANGVGALFTGNDTTTPESLFGSSTLTAAQYNSLWLTWGGFLIRPDNFDDLVAERYGSAFGSGRNPYPKPFENPNTTNGGSGRLPEMFTQLRNPDGSWSGRIGITCHACHSGAANGSVTYGGGSSLQDVHLLRARRPSAPAVARSAANLTPRGTNNASDINLAFLFPDEGVYDLDTFFGLLASGSTASMDTPAWWNMGHRPVKFVDGVFPMDAPRVIGVLPVLRPVRLARRAAQPARMDAHGPT